MSNLLEPPTAATGTSTTIESPLSGRQLRLRSGRPSDTPKPRPSPSVEDTDDSRSKSVIPDPGKNAPKRKMISQSNPRPWMHPQELRYICDVDFPQKILIQYLCSKSFSIPPREINSTIPLFHVTTRDGTAIGLPRGYRVPLMFVAKFQWDSLKLVLTAPDRQKEWEEYKFDIIHLCRLSERLFTQATEAHRRAVAAGAKGIDRLWRSVTFDRVLTRVYHRWFVSREWSIRKFWEEFDDDEYDADVLKHDWTRWALKGHKGFTLTKDQILEGISAKNFMHGLSKNSQGTWIWDESLPQPTVTSRSSIGNLLPSSPSHGYPLILEDELNSSDVTIARLEEVFGMEAGTPSYNTIQVKKERLEPAGESLSTIDKSKVPSSGFCSSIDPASRLGDSTDRGLPKNDSANPPSTSASVGQKRHGTPVPNPRPIKKRWAVQCRKTGPEISIKRRSVWPMSEFLNSDSSDSKRKEKDSSSSEDDSNDSDYRAPRNSKKRKLKKSKITTRSKAALATSIEKNAKQTKPTEPMGSRSRLNPLRVVPNKSTVVPPSTQTSAVFPSSIPIQPSKPPVPSQVTGPLFAGPPAAIAIARPEPPRSMTATVPQSEKSGSATLLIANNTGKAPTPSTSKPVPTTHHTTSASMTATVPQSDMSGAGAPLIADETGKAPTPSTSKPVPTTHQTASGSMAATVPQPEMSTSGPLSSTPQFKISDAAAPLVAGDTEKAATPSTPKSVPTTHYTASGSIPATALQSEKSDAANPFTDGTDDALTLSIFNLVSPTHHAMTGPTTPTVPQSEMSGAEAPSIAENTGEVLLSEHVWKEIRAMNFEPRPHCFAKITEKAPTPSTSKPVSLTHHAMSVPRTTTEPQSEMTGPAALLIADTPKAPALTSKPVSPQSEMSDSAAPLMAENTEKAPTPSTSKPVSTTSHGPMAATVPQSEMSSAAAPSIAENTEKVPTPPNSVSTTHHTASPTTSPLGSQGTTADQPSNISEAHADGVFEETVVNETASNVFPAPDVEMTANASNSVSATDAAGQEGSVVRHGSSELPLPPASEESSIWAVDLMRLLQPTGFSAPSVSRQDDHMDVDEPVATSDCVEGLHGLLASLLADSKRIRVRRTMILRGLLRDQQILSGSVHTGETYRLPLSLSDLRYTFTDENEPFTLEEHLELVMGCSSLLSKYATIYKGRELEERMIELDGRLQQELSNLGVVQIMAKKSEVGVGNDTPVYVDKEVATVGHEDHLAPGTLGGERVENVDEIMRDPVIDDATRRSLAPEATMVDLSSVPLTSTGSDTLKTELVSGTTALTTGLMVSMMRNMADLLDCTSGSGDSGNERTALATSLLDELKSMKMEIQQKVESIARLHQAELVSLNEQMRARDDKYRRETELLRQHHREEMGSVRETMKKRATVEGEGKLPSLEMLELRRRITALENRTRHLPTQAGPSNRPGYEDESDIAIIRRAPFHPLGHLFDYEDSASLEGINSVSKPGTPIQPEHSNAVLIDSIPLPIKSQRKFQSVHRISLT